MYIYLKNINKIHFYGKFLYIYKANSWLKLNELKSLIFIEILKGNNNFDDLIDKVSKNNFNINYFTFSKIVIDEMKEILEISFKKNKRKKLIYSGIKNKYFPYNIQILLTNKCLHSCLHCYKYSNSIKNQKIDINKLFSFFNYIKNKTPEIEFSGGDPFLYEELDEIINNYYNDFYFSIITSGNWKNKPSPKLIEKFDNIKLTLYGYSEKTHNYFVGNKNSFKKVIKNIQYIQRYNKNLTIQTQVKSNDIEEIENFIKLSIKIGIKNIVFGEVLMIGRAINNKDNFNNYDFNLIRNNLFSLREKYKGIINISYIDSPKNLSKENFFNCKAGTLSWSVLETGDITPCTLLIDEIFYLGNIYLDDYKKLINLGFEKYNNIYINNFEKIKNKYKKKGENINNICGSILKK